MATRARRTTNARRGEWTPEPGMRVRFRGRGPSFTLAVDTGTVEGPDPVNHGYYFVRLDEPGTYFCADGTTAPLPVVREADDNLLPLADSTA